MLLRQTHRTRGRRGSAIVEASLSLTIFCLLLFGVFEYCRYLFVLHVTDLAAREGVRYAAVNSNQPTNFDTGTGPFTDGSGATLPNIKTYTMGRLGGADKQIAGFTFTVFPVDPAGLLLSPAQVNPKTGFPTTVFWNSASFPDRMAVRISGTFKPFLPNLTMMPTMPINVTALSGIEG
jgi:Flp pilus assembly protein TadG